MSMSVCRHFSFEGQQLHLEVATSAAVGRLPGSKRGTEESWTSASWLTSDTLRAGQVEQLEVYLAAIAELGAAKQGEEGLIEFPPNFVALVQTMVLGKQLEAATTRGWLATNNVASTSGTASKYASALPAMTNIIFSSRRGSSIGLSVSGGLTCDPEPCIYEALQSVQLLDRALAEADQRAAAVAAAGRALERRMEQIEAGQASNSTKGEDALAESASPPWEVAVSSGGLAAAMQYGRQRLQREARLNAALQEAWVAAEVTAISCSGKTMTDFLNTDTAVGSTGASFALCEADQVLLQSLLRQLPASAAELGAVNGSRAPINPFEQPASDLAAIDAQLVALHGADGGPAGPVAAAPPAEDAPATASSSGGEGHADEEECDLEVIRERYLRAQCEACATARRLKDIDAAVRALKTGVSTSFDVV